MTNLEQNNETLTSHLFMRKLKLMVSLVSFSLQYGRVNNFGKQKILRCHISLIRTNLIEEKSLLHYVLSLFLSGFFCGNFKLLVRKRT